MNALNKNIICQNNYNKILTYSNLIYQTNYNNQRKYCHSYITLFTSRKYNLLNSFNKLSIRYSSTSNISEGIQNNTIKTAASTNSKSTKKRLERIAPIILTERAATRIKELIESKDDGIIGVRISVKRRGCNGYSYTMNYASKEDLDKKSDEVVSSHGVTVLVDPKAIFFLVGTVMDFEETLLASEFTFNNPNSKGECGCGESFNV